MPADQPTLLVLGGGVQQVPVLAEAQKMHVRTILLDQSSLCPGRAYSGEFHCISTTMIPAVMEFARKRNGNGSTAGTNAAGKIDGVIAYASDPAALTAAMVAQELGLPGNPVRAAEILSNKKEFRDFLRKNGFAVPHYHVLSENEAGYGPNLTSPFLVKCVDSSGSRGVGISWTEVDFSKVYDDAKALSRSGTVLEEEFIRLGYRHIIGGDIVVLDGRIILNGLMDCIREPAHALVPCGKAWPMELDPSMQRAVLSVLARIISLLQIRTAEMNVELILGKNGKIYPLDMGLRAGGNEIVNLLSDISGQNLIRWNINAALGRREELELPPNCLTPEKETDDGCGQRDHSCNRHGAIHSRRQADMKDNKADTAGAAGNPDGGSDTECTVLSRSCDCNAGSTTDCMDPDAGDTIYRRSRNGVFVSYNLHAEEKGFFAGCGINRELRPYLYYFRPLKKPGDLVMPFVNASQLAGILRFHFPDRAVWDLYSDTLWDRIRVVSYQIQPDPGQDAADAALQKLDRYLTRIQGKREKRVWEQKVVARASTYLALSKDMPPQIKNQRSGSWTRVAARIPIGLVSFYQNDPRGKTAYITALSVEPAFRGCGVAAHLLEDVFKTAILAGFSEICGEISRENTACLQLAKKAGYRPYGETSHHTVLVRKDLEG